MAFNGKEYLLVRERGRSEYSLPGGGIERGEPSLLAAVRELYEETRLKVSAIRYIGDLDGQRARHYVFFAEVYGNIRLQRKEIESSFWWDANSPIKAQGHVKGALALLKQGGVSNIPPVNQESHHNSAP